MTDIERAMEIARARLDDADQALYDAEDAAAQAYQAWKEADHLMIAVEAGDADAIRQMLEGQR